MMNRDKRLTGSFRGQTVSIRSMAGWVALLVSPRDFELSTPTALVFRPKLISDRPGSPEGVRDQLGVADGEDYLNNPTLDTTQNA